MSESKGASRAVDRMLDAIRGEEPPEMDWEAIERSLMGRIRRGEGARPQPKRTAGVGTALMFAAAAAIVPIALSLGGSPAGGARTGDDVRAVDVASIGRAPGETGSAPARDLTALRRGDAVEASDGEVTFADAGKVRWTLSPESRLVVRSPVPQSGVGHVVQLTRGSVRVEVQPDLVKNGLVDVLAVEVGNTRIAVHGTVFTVTLRDGEVLVDVEHGVVTVGPAGAKGATTGYQLPAGSRAAFSLDGARRARWLPKTPAKPAEPVAAVVAPPPDVAVGPAPVVPPAPVDDDTPSLLDPPPAPSVKPGPAVAARPASTANPAAPPDPAPAVTAPEPPKVTMNAGTVQAGLLRCFRQAHPAISADGPRLTASSTFTLKIRADGSVEGAQFSPPLPSIQGCAAFVWSGRFTPGASSYTLSIPVQLSQ
ncbi:MAG: FecR family protein [Polyangiaceae bacterium]